MKRKQPLAVLAALFWCLMALPAVAASAPVSVTRSAHATPATFSIHCEDAPVSQVLTGLFQRAGFHFILGQNLHGTVTINVTDLGFGLALRIVSRAARPQLVYCMRAGVYLVDLAPPPLPSTFNPHVMPNEPQPQIGASGLLPGPRFVPSVASSWPRVSWGRADRSGLQMGVWKPAGEAQLLCIIRNQGPMPARYWADILGYWENVRVYARPHGTVEFKRVPFLWRGLIGYGSHIGEEEVLAPGQMVPWRPGGSFVKPTVTHWDAVTLSSSFTMEFGAFDWPPSKDGLDIKVTQFSPYTKLETLDSGVITHPVQAVSEANGTPVASPK